jgi:hypothetical protein
MFGLKINFSKSEVIMVSQDDDKSFDYSNMFNCAIGKWPIKYLGVPVAGSRLHVADWLPISEKILKRLWVERRLFESRWEIGVNQFLFEQSTCVCYVLVLAACVSPGQDGHC